VYASPKFREGICQLTWLGGIGQGKDKFSAEYHLSGDYYWKYFSIPQNETVI